MTAVQVTIHVGLSKAASTFLQESFFPAVKDALFVHAPYTAVPEPNPIQRFVRALFTRNVACLDLPRIRDEIAAFVQRSGHARVLVSSEALFGTPFENNADFRRNADVLAEVFEAPKIWFIVRRQDTWLESWYSQLLKMGLSTSPARFTNYRAGAFGDHELPVYAGPNLDVRDLDWSCYVQHYRRTFGTSNLLVQAHEGLRVDPAEFLGRFCGFAGIAPFVPEPARSVNPSLSPVAAALARAVNLLPAVLKQELRGLVPGTLHPARVLDRLLGPVLPERRLFPPTLARAALRLHHENNRRLAELIDEDLAPYGYYEALSPRARG